MKRRYYISYRHGLLVNGPSPQWLVFRVQRILNNGRPYGPFVAAFPTLDKAMDAIYRQRRYEKALTKGIPWPITR